MFKHLLIMLVLLVSTTAQAALNIQHWTLENGTRVYFVENHSIPMLDVSVEFDAGARRDPKGKSGVAALTNSMLGRGVRAAKLPSGVDEPALTEAQISDAFADIAAQRGGGPE
jgi:zinc protease